VWREGTQVQRVSSLERRKEVTSGRRGGMCGHTTKGIAKGVEEKSGTCPTTKSAGVLWRGHSRCYESPKKEQVSHAFKYLVANIKSYNADKI